MSQRRQRAARKARQGASQAAAPHAAPARLADLPPARALAWPLAFTLMLVAFAAVPAVNERPALLGAVLGAAGSLLAWNGALLALARRAGRRLAVDVVLRKQHYVQACAQLSVYLYWGWYWREVYDSAHLIAAQLVFAYAFDMLLTWSRRDRYTLGFGPFPIIFSINLFMWFKPDWFALQFVMVAVGFAVKELIRWTRDGRRVHIFNPSSFPLGLFALLLIATGTTDLTWGPEIAVTQIFPPYIYLLIFAASLPAQLLFGVVSMTLSAVVTTYAFILVHFALTGSHFFSPASLGGGAVPIAAFLGMHLLFNDPSTSPRTELGRIVFGILYGASIIVLFGLLERTGIPTHYDKLLAVPVLNLLIRAIDSAARSDVLRRLDPAALGRALTPVRRNLAYVAVWAVVFVAMQLQTGTEVALARGVSLLSQGRVAETIAHYRDVVRAQPERAVLQNELGYVLLRAGRTAEALGPLEAAAALAPDVAQTHNSLGVAHVRGRRRDAAVAAFRRALELQPDYPEASFNLAQLHDGGRGVAADPAEAARLYRQAAARGHAGAQVNLGRLYRDGRGVRQDDAAAVRWYQRAADQGHPFAQFNLALMYRAGDGVAQDDVAAHMWLSLAAARLAGDEREAAAAARARAVDSRAALERRMSPGQVAAAERLARQWRPGAAARQESAP